MTKDEVVAAIRTLPAGGPRVHLALRLFNKRQYDLGKELKLNQSTVSQIVTGKRSTSEAERAVIAKALKLSVADLFGEDKAA